MSDTTTKPYETRITLDAYEIANLRWAFRKMRRLGREAGSWPKLYFDTGDWFGQLEAKLYLAAGVVSDYVKPNGDGQPDDES